MIEFEVIGQLRGKGRPRFTRTGRTYTPQTTAEYEKLIRLSYLKTTRYKSDKAIRVTILVFKQVQKSETKKKADQKLKNEIKCVCKPDIDNIVKVVLDALNKVAYKDDNQVIELVVAKRYAKIEKLKIKIEEVD